MSGKLTDDELVLLGALQDIDKSRVEYSRGDRTQFSKETYRRIPMHEWTIRDLDELSQVRGVALGTLGGEILQKVLSLWQRFATDQDLYLKRVENPAESDIQIQGKPKEKACAVSLDSSEEWTRRRVMLAVFHYISAGNDPGFVYDLLDQIDGE